MFNGQVVIYADGGCEGNGSPTAQAFGSYVLRAYNGDQLVKQIRSRRIDYPQHKTNNAAEFQAVIDALSQLQPGEYSVHLFSDSQLVVNVLSGQWQTDKPHLVALVQQAQQIMDQLPGLFIEWRSRDVIVRELGH
jgi:ribonuclease HI